MTIKRFEEQTFDLTTPEGRRTAVEAIYDELDVYLTIVQRYDIHNTAFNEDNLEKFRLLDHSAEASAITEMINFTHQVKNDIHQAWLDARLQVERLRLILKDLYMHGRLLGMVPPDDDEIGYVISLSTDKIIDVFSYVQELNRLITDFKATFMMNDFMLHEIAKTPEPPRLKIVKTPKAKKKD